MATCSGRSPRLTLARLAFFLLVAALAAWAQGPSPRNPGRPGGMPTPTPGPSPSAQIPGSSFTGWIPPDTMGAVGPNHLVSTVNSQVRFTDRSGNVLASLGLTQFWQNWGAGVAGDSCFDPSCVYDPYNDRFIVICSANGQSSTSCIFIGVSATGDPTGSWYAWKVQTYDSAAQTWGDQPRVGFNRNWIVLTITIYNMSDSFQGSNLYIFDKASLYAGLGRPGSPPHTLQTYGNPLLGNVIAPAVTLDNAIGTEYLVESNSPSVSLLQITGVVGAESLTPVGSYSSVLGGWNAFGPDAPQSGIGARVDTGDDRIMNAQYRNGSVWCAHTVFLPAGGPTRSSAQWWQLSTASVGTVQQLGRIDDPTGANFYAFPTVAVNSLDDAIVGCSCFSSTTHPSAAYAMRYHGDVAGTQRTPVVYQPGLATYALYDTVSRNRWGDYSASCVDPTNDVDLWTIQEYVSAQNQWATAWARVAVAVSPPSAPGTPSADVNPNVGTFNVSWAAATDPGGPGILGYLPERSADGGATWTAFPLQAATSLSQTGLPAGSYVYRVRAEDTVGTVGPYSSVSATVVVYAPPSVPVLQSPTNGVGVVSGAVPLAWGASSAGAGIQDYDAQVSASSDFSSVAWSATDAANGATTSVLTDGTYWWEVRSRDTLGNVSAWSAAWSFIVDPATPAVPAPSGPADGATVTTARPILSWSSVSSPSGVTYQVEVAASNPVAAPLEASVSGLASPSWPAPRLSDGTHYWHVRAVNGGGTPGPWSATMTIVVNGKKGFTVGVGVGGHGDIAPFQSGAAGYAARPLALLPWAAYDSKVGATRPAAGDLFGDGRTELVVGTGSYPSGGGYLAVLLDTGSALALQRWLRVPWAAYDSANGETYPTCGDIDGDGRAEIVVGLGKYTAAGGYFLIFDDASSGYAPIGWRRVGFPAYNAYDGQTRPAVGDIDGNGASEVLIGLGKYPAQGGFVYRFTDRTVSPAGTLRLNWAAYQAANGETWPACGDVDGNGIDEVCIGLGSYRSAGGWMKYLGSATTGFALVGWVRIPWSTYNATSGEARPALGHLTGASGDQTVVGLGRNVGAVGKVVVFDRAPGFAPLCWRAVSDPSYDSANGETRPTIGR